MKCTFIILITALVAFSCQAYEKCRESRCVVCIQDSECVFHVPIMGTSGVCVLKSAYGDTRSKMLAKTVAGCDRYQKWTAKREHATAFKKSAKNPFKQDDVENAVIKNKEEGERGGSIEQVLELPEVSPNEFNISLPTVKALEDTFEKEKKLLTNHWTTAASDLEQSTLNPLQEATTQASGVTTEKYESTTLDSYHAWRQETMRRRELEMKEKQKFMKSIVTPIPTLLTTISSQNIVENISNRRGDEDMLSPSTTAKDIDENVRSAERVTKTTVSSGKADPVESQKDLETHFEVHVEDLRCDKEGFYENEIDVMDRSTCRTYELHIKRLIRGEMLFEAIKNWNRQSPAVQMPKRCVTLLWKRRNCKTT